ncbi:hypothetical protein [Novosphingobium soli]|uniref:SGNH/GDSL hydrolase family protein n=1 Tax=Novosphingobium soli TaxID=574956 RepID=A0ABV6CW50_9SPHN
MKYFNGLNMGEGIVGGSDVGMRTTQIYTCMGIAFANTRTQRGGLYHYPADCLGNANVVGTIRQMLNDVAPDVVVVTPAMAQGYGQLTGSSRDDIDGVEALLKQLGAPSVTVAEPRTSAVLVWNATGPVFNEVPDETGRAVASEIRGTMSTGRRELEAGVWYYGGDGEQGDLLDQGLPASPPSSSTSASTGASASGGGRRRSTKESAKGCCIIM